MPGREGSEGERVVATGPRSVPAFLLRMRVIWRFARRGLSGRGRAGWNACEIWRARATPWAVAAIAAVRGSASRLPRFGGGQAALCVRSLLRARLSDAVRVRGLLRTRAL